MSTSQVRLLAFALASIVLIVAGNFFLAWHRVSVMGGSIELSLRSMDICATSQGCITLDFGKNPRLSGMYPTFGGIVYFGSVAMMLLVAWQAGTRVLAGHASEQLSRGGYGLGVTLAGLGFMCGYVLIDQSMFDAGMGFATAERGAGPLVLLLGQIAGIVALYMAASEAYDDGTSFKPVDPPLPEAKVVAGGAAPRPTHKSEPIPKVTAERPVSSPSYVVPEALRNRLRYLAITGELTAAGIDARREDGTSVLVLWRDVVGAVARRLPPMHDSHPFVDIVSTAKSTVRIMAFTRLTGDPLPMGSGAVGEDDVRARALLRLVLERCPDAKLDPATQQFLDDDAERPPQLPDPETLAAHDNRLA